MGKMGASVAQAVGIGLLVLILFRAIGWFARAVASMAASLSYWSEEAAIAAGIIFLIVIVLTDKKS